MEGVNMKRIVIVALIVILFSYSIIATIAVREEREEKATLMDLRNRNLHSTIDKNHVEACAWEALGRYYINGNLEQSMDAVISTYNLSSGDALEVLDKVRELHKLKS